MAEKLETVAPMCLVVGFIQLLARSATNPRTCNSLAFRSPAEVVTLIGNAISAVLFLVFGFLFPF